jgi:hypothetical protein
MPDKKWSLFENGVPGVHLIIHPPKPLPAEAQIRRQFVGHNLTLSYAELQALMAGRKEGIGALKNVIDRVLPGFAPDKRLQFSTQIADALVDKSLSAQLSREAPTSLDEIRQTEELLNHVLVRGPPPTLLERVPIGASVTVYF